MSDAYPLAPVAAQRTDDATSRLRKDPVWLRWQIAAGAVGVVELLICFKLFISFVHSKGGPTALVVFVACFLAGFLIWMIGWLLPRRYSLRIVRRTILVMSLMVPLVTFLIPLWQSSGFGIYYA
ncbi:MAG: hypothetical protein DLM55_07745 [Acidimicrobiales bacterium]|nr:MAG: hypothetical protein DLM55_07745 [Acidimicrobiales bacterium]